MVSQPFSPLPTPISGLPEYAGSSTLGYFPYVVDGVTYKAQIEQVVAAVNVPPSRIIAAGTGLTGGGDLSQNRTISVLAGGIGDTQLDVTGVSAGTYGSAINVPQITVNAKGRVTTVTDVPIVLTGFVPTSRQIIAGNGLTGGGALTADRTLSANYYASDPAAPSQTASAGASIQLSRGDHVHPAPDLSDPDQIQGVLPLDSGGTGAGLTPLSGAVVYSTDQRFALTAVGTAGDTLRSQGPGLPPVWAITPGTGTVTSVALSGGTTGLTVTGSPITTSGTFVLAGTLAVANGGTGVTTSTGTGSVVLSNSPTLVTPVLGAASATSLNVSGAITGLDNIQAGAANSIYWNTRTILQSPSNGVLRVLNNLGSNYFDITIGSGGANTTATFSGGISIPNLTLVGGTVTVSTPVIDATQTWNNVATTFTGVRLDVTKTAAATASLAIDIRVDGVSQFNVRQDGRTLVREGLNVGAFLSIGSTLTIGNDTILSRRSAAVFATNSAQLIGSTVTMTNGAAAQLGTLTNAPTAGNPTKWVPINDNGVTRYLPAW